MSNTAAADGPPPNNSEFYRLHTLDALLEGAPTIGSVQDLLIDDLTDDEAEAFFAALEQ